MTTSLHFGFRGLLLVVLLAGGGALAQDKPAETPELTELNWPRKFEDAGDTVIVYDPQVESWENHELLKARCAVVVTASGDKAEAFVKRVLGKQPHLTVSLDFILTYMKDRAEKVPSVKVSLAPPPIYVSEEPAILVIFMGEPDFKPVKGSSTLKFATNTNWDVITSSTDMRYYLLNGEGWIATKDLRKGPWEMVSKLPEEFSRLPADENWSETRKSIPGKLITVPKVFISTEPAEMILLD